MKLAIRDLILQPYSLQAAFPHLAIPEARCRWKGVGLGARIVLFPTGDGAQAPARAGLKAAHPRGELGKVLSAKCESGAAFQAGIQDLG